MRDILNRLFDAFNGLQQSTLSPMANLERSLAAAHHAHTSARRTLALAMAEETRETERRLALVAKTSDLEQRAIAALRAGRDDLANQAAEAIAAMTADINASEHASQRFLAEVTLARREVEAQRNRLSELDRGRRLARIGNAVTATIRTSETGLDRFSEAEAALAKVTAENHDARFVQRELTPPTAHLIERLSDAGFGETTQIHASDVLMRLRAAAATDISQLIESNANH
jgi:phage shock protein A